MVLYGYIKENGRIKTFFFYSPLMSTMFYDVYDPEGNRLEVKDPISFIDESSQWKCIYLPALADMLSASI